MAQHAVMLEKGTVAQHEPSCSVHSLQESPQASLRLSPLQRQQRLVGCCVLSSPVITAAATVSIHW